MVLVYKQAAEDSSMLRISSILGDEKCESYLIFYGETVLGNGLRAFLYFLGLAYCFIGMSAITARFFRSMENVVKHTRTIVQIYPDTNTEIIRQEKEWNYTFAEISLLAFWTSFSQISLATIDAIQTLVTCMLEVWAPELLWVQLHSTFFQSMLFVLLSQKLKS